MARTKSLARIRAEMEKLEREMKEAREREAERIAAAAVKAGLADLDLSDKDLTDIFAEIFARFRDKSAKPSRSHPAPAGHAE